MKNFIKISLFVIIAVSAVVFSNVETVSAQATCAACGDNTETPTTPGGGGGGSTPNPPSCSISASDTRVAAGDTYEISWNGTDNATYRLNNALVNASGSYDYTMAATSEYTRFVIYGKNHDGECADEVLVYQEIPAPVCDIDLSISTANVGDAYVVTWDGGPSTASFQINGSNVPDSGTANFTFTGPNEDSFTMTGDNYGESCSKVVKVTKKVTEIPGCTEAGALNYNPDATVNDNSCEYPEIPKCEDTSALNYGEEGDCEYPETPKKCELTVTKSVDKHAATPGEDLTYTIKVKNTGTADCTGGGVRIQDTLDANFDYQSNTYTSNLSEGYGSHPVYTASDRTVRFNGHVLNPGESGTIVLFGKIATPHSCGDYVVENKARATARELNNFQDWSYSTQVTTNVDYDCEVENKLPVCESFTATPGMLPYGGGTVTLDWDLLRTATAVINNGVGDVTVGSPDTDKTMSGTKTVNVTESTIFTLTATDVDGDKVTCQAPVVVNPPVPAPTCDSFTANPETIFVGGKSVLSWESTNAVQAFINNAIGAVDVDSSIEVSPLADTTYVLTLIGAEDKTVDCHVPVKVKEVVDEMPVCKAFTADPTSLPVGGGNTTLAWEVEDAVDVTINNGVGTGLSLVDSKSVAVTETTTFVLTATDDNGDKVTCPALVEVEKEEVKDPAVCEAFSATPSALPVGGGDVVLNWIVLDATSVSINQGVGAVSLTGTSDAINVTESKTFVLTAVGEDGKEVTCPAPVAVADPVVFTCENNVSFSASDSSISRGQSSTLNWSTTNVDSLTISGINATALSGNETVSPNGDTTYTLEATQGSQTISCPVKIDVSTGGGGGGSSSPRCELDISSKRITAGEEVELSWDSTRARELKITDNFGNVLVNTDDKLGDAKDDLFEGTLTLNPTRNTTYTMVVERGSRDRECEVEVEMDDEITLLQVRDQAPLVSGISLTQVPYTGFEAGPVMTVLFYMLLVTWALYITYVLVMPKARLAMVPVTNNGVKTNEDLMQNAEQIRPDVFAAVASAPVVEAPANLPTSAVVPEVIAEAVVSGVNTPDMPVVAEIPDTNTVENQAHALQALVSSDAARTIAGMVEGGNQAEVVAKIVADAKGAFPLEDGWVVINQSRLAQLTDTTAVSVSPSPTGAGSLAEAIVTGNVVAAYDLVGARPMIALADAATDLDALYRTRKGAAAEVSDMLQAETANISDEQIAEMIAALTGALDGTYSDEASAVKMAIMKAVQIAG